MNITRQNIDDLNAVVKIEISADDYKDKVANILNDYRKKANIPGFRKGQVPMGMIKKQYGHTVKSDEVNKILQENLNSFINSEKIEILANPMPKINDDFSWDNDDFSFEFELGLSPKFEVNLKSKEKINKYEIEADDSLLNEEIENLQRRHGNVTPLEEATSESNISGTFISEEHGVNRQCNFYVTDLKGNKNTDKVLGTKVGDKVEFNIKNLFDEDFKISQKTGLPLNNIKDLDFNLNFTVDGITKIEPAELNEDFYNKLSPDGAINNIENLKESIKSEAERQFQKQADNELVTKVQASLIENTKFDLPSKFLQKWIRTSGEKELTEEEAKIEYQNSEKGLRYQLIQSKIMKDNDIKVDLPELENYAQVYIKSKMQEYGNMDFDEEQTKQIARNLLNNKSESERLYQELIHEKFIDFFNENIDFNIKKMNYKDFITEVYS